MPGIDGYACQWPNCGWCFTSTQRRHRHNVQVHGGQLRPPQATHALPFQCQWTDCMLRFSTTRLLVQHVERVHDGHYPAPIIHSISESVTTRVRPRPRVARRTKHIFHANVDFAVIAYTQDEARTIARMIIEHSPDEPRVMHGAVRVNITTGVVYRGDGYD